MKFLSKELIELNKELSDLDKFTLDFVDILKKHTNYVIVSGYVAILLGRSRISEDIDIIIPKIELNKFKDLFKELYSNNFYCLNSEDKEELFSEYLKKGLAIRFAKNNTAIPNIELKLAKKGIDNISLEKIIKVKINNQELIISNLELQIAFKEKVLKSPKDMEDARHLRNIGKSYINEGIIKKYEVLLDGI